jgi:outer membrane protein assembly factor BamB
MLSVSLAVAVAVLSADAKTFDWPQWRGPNRDGTSAETGLLQEWPKGGPPLAWTVKGCGGGYASVVVSEGFIYGGGRKDRKDCVWCRKESDGSEVWTTPFADGKQGSDDEGVRGTPTVAGGRVYCVSGGGVLVCLDAKTGLEKWKKSYTKDFGGSVQGWGYCESVLVDGETVICTPCANKAAVVALKAKDGEVIWKTEVKNAGGAGGYSSPVKTTVGKTDMYVNLLGNAGGVVGVDAKTGKLLWQYTKIMNGTANVPTPVVKGDRVWCSTGYDDGGSALLHIKESGGKFEAEELKYYDSKQLQNHHGGMVLVGEYVFLGNRHNSGIPACVEFKTGEIQWKEEKGAGGGGGSGSVVYADGMLYFRYENGKVALVKANPKKFELAGSFDIPEKSGKPSWQHPVVANGKLYIRDQDKLHCFDVKKK